MPSLSHRNARSSVQMFPAAPPWELPQNGQPPSPAMEASIRELEYQSEVAEWVAADVINVHGGGSYGDKRTALDS